MSRLKDELRLKLLGQLSSEKTELDVDTAFEVCKKVSVSFFIWAKSYQNNDRNNWHLTAEELYNKFLENYDKESN